ncbi:hypothetical protein [Marisediminicola sp. LYQ134]|uniref:hypothetical protein n=1 Tax=unclassified Marisediminicola TaxID=2618316 RepID=UPI003983604D
MMRSTLVWALATAAEDAEEFDPNTVTPGVVGFFVMFAIAAIAVLLILDMTRRVRRTRYRGEISERLDAEEAAAGSDPDAEPDHSAEGRRIGRDEKDPDPVA